MASVIGLGRQFHDGRINSTQTTRAQAVPADCWCNMAFSRQLQRRWTRNLIFLYFFKGRTNRKLTQFPEWLIQIQGADKQRMVDLCICIYQREMFRGSHAGHQILRDIWATSWGRLKALESWLAEKERVNRWGAMNLSPITWSWCRTPARNDL